MIVHGATEEEAAQAAELWELLYPSLKVIQLRDSGPLVKLGFDYNTKTPLGLLRVIKHILGGE
jgi:hypothetical protein